MFDGKKYITKGVDAKIPTEQQWRMWDMIEVARREIEQLDYLQVFELDRFREIQKITHHQEQPEFEKEYLMATEDIVEAKVFVNDSSCHCTILLAREY